MTAICFMCGDENTVTAAFFPHPVVDFKTGKFRSFERCFCECHSHGDGWLWEQEQEALKLEAQK